MTQPIDLDALQAAAEAALQHGEDIGETDWHEPGHSITMEATCPDAELICACSPGLACGSPSWRRTGGFF